MAVHRALIGRPRAGSQRGMSIVEILVLLGILTAMVAFALPTNPTNDLVAADARRLVADGLRTRSVARTQWTPTMMQFDLGGGRWRCATTDGDPILSSDSDANGWRTLTNGVDFGIVAGKDSVFVFLPNGRALAEAGILLTGGNADWEVSTTALSGTISSGPSGG